jgi:hypothetical protein
MKAPDCPRARAIGGAHEARGFAALRCAARAECGRAAAALRLFGSRLATTRSYTQSQSFAISSLRAKQSRE